MNTDFEIKNNIENLKQRLYLEVYDYNEEARRLPDIKSRLDLLSSICEMLKNNDLNNNDLLGLFLLIENAYPKDIYEYYEKKLLNYVLSKNDLRENSEYFEKEINNSKSNFNSIRSSINKDFESELIKYRKCKNFVYKNKKRIISYRKIISGFKFNTVIDKDELDALMCYFNENDVPVSKITLFLEIIKEHNLSIKNPTQKIYKSGFEMLLDKYHELQIDYKYENEELDGKINNYMALISNDDFVENVKCLPKVTRGEVTLEEYDYIYISILNNIAKEISDLKMDLCDSYTNSDDAELNKVIFSVYRDYKDRYNVVFKEYRTDREKYLEREKLNDEINMTYNPENEYEKNVIFLKNNGKVYLDSDMKDIPEEYYSRVYDLLDGFRNGTLGSRSVKPLVNNDEFKSFRELKDDQVRIVYKEIGNNCYLILGVGVKKANSDVFLLKKLTKRYKKLSDTEIKELENESSSYFDEIKKFVLENGRKGNR